MTTPLLTIDPAGPKPDKDCLAGSWPSFAERLAESGCSVHRRPLRTLQINVGKLCNQTCRHCHVEAGPHRREQMTWETAERVVELMDAPGGRQLDTVDITGGAPELNSVFRYLVRESRARAHKVIDRCNLTILVEEGQEGTAPFLAAQSVEVIASLPCYSRENVEQQRGKGVFDKSVRALRMLNELGYGEGDLVLNLVYNPVGPFLPPAQDELESDYKERLLEDFGVRFDRLFTITNMPIKRFLYDLKHADQVQEYMMLLVNSFNRSAVEDLMCRDLISIGWDGQIYDCDFNQMVEIPSGRDPKTIWSVETLESFNDGSIAVEDHCYGCTAGAGSSCGGQLV